MSLADAVGANKSVLVAMNGWTEQAELKAIHTGLDLRILTLEDALDLIVKDKWFMCDFCQEDCVVLDREGGIIIEGMLSLFNAGQCRNCKSAIVWCWDCGEHILLSFGNEAKCLCKHRWKTRNEDIFVKPKRERKWIPIERNADSIFEIGAPDTILVKDGIELRKQGQIDNAISEFTKVIRTFPKSFVAYYQRAITYDEFESFELSR